MADTKISALTSATTPLAGTEVLPIVQSSTTKKVAVSDLTVGRDVVASSFQASNRIKVAPTAIYDAPGPTGNNTGIAFSGNLWLPCDGTGALTNGTCSLGSGSYQFNEGYFAGNVIFGTAAKGINFTANTAAAGKTSQLLNWYEEGTFTPTITDATYNATMGANNFGRYTRIGRLVVCHMYVETTSLGSIAAGAAVYVSGWPFAIGKTGGAVASQASGLAIGANQSLTLRPWASTLMRLAKWDATTGTTEIVASNWTASGAMYITVSYEV